MIRGGTDSRGVRKKDAQRCVWDGTRRRHLAVATPGLHLGRAGVTLGSQTYTLTRADTEQSVFMTTDK